MDQSDTGDERTEGIWPEGPPTQADPGYGPEAPWPPPPAWNEPAPHPPYPGQAAPSSPGSGGWGPPPPYGPNPYSPYGAAPNWGGWVPPAAPAAQARWGLPGAIIAVLVVAALLAGVAIGHGVWRPTRPSLAGGQLLPGGQALPGGFGTPSFGQGGSGTSIDVSKVAAEVDPALVDIDITLVDGAAAGTGIVLSSDGYVLTNNHVISGATSIKATDVGNGKTYDAQVVGYDRSRDVAVIKLAGASGLKTAVFGNSSQVRVGQPVVGIGNAGGTGGTPSTAPGVVTALDQSITAEDQSTGSTERLSGLIETNANIQPGDSGGALANAGGQVVGMDTAASAGFSFSFAGNQGFAIPINEARNLARLILAGQSSAQVHVGPTAFLGVEVQVSSGTGGPPVQGAAVARALPGGPAASVGVQGGDVIVGLGSQTVTSAGQLTDLLGRYRPGQQVKLTWVDPAGNTHSALVTLGSGPPQ